MRDARINARTRTKTPPVGGCVFFLDRSPPLSSLFSLSPNQNDQQYDAKLCKLLDTYDKAFLVHADNVGSRQFMDIRRVRF